jgi:hypothetical protein
MIDIIGIDPGGTTGIAHVTEKHGFGVYEKTPDNAITWVANWLNAVQDDVTTYIACERYIIGRQTTRATRQSDALHVIGAIETAACKCNTVFRLQSASDAKMITNDTLRRAKLYMPKMTHGNDAMRHAMLLILRQFPHVYQSLLTRGTINF